MVYLHEEILDEIIKSRNKIKISIILISSIFLLEFFGGIYTRSLSLLSDSFHVLFDLVSLLIGFIAVTISLKPTNSIRTYGYHRGEVLASFVNALLLIVIVGIIFKKAYERFLLPRKILVDEMLIIAIIGLIVNIVVMLKLKAHTHDVNIKGIFLHVLGDTLSSINVIIAGILMYFTRNYIFDPIMSLIIGGIILFGAVRLLIENVHILLDSVPKNINRDEIERKLLNTKGVEDIHDLHIWSLCSHVTLLSAHIVVSDASNIDKIRKELEEKVKEYNITHTTFQFEIESCNRGCEKFEGIKLR